MAEQRKTAPPVPTAVTVRQLGDAPQEMARWQAYLAKSPHATIYHDLAWREIFGAALGYESFLLIAEDASGACRGLLPLYQVPWLTGSRRLIAVPFRDRGGVLFDCDEAFRALVAQAWSISQRIGARSVELKTIEPYPARQVEAAGLARSDHWIHSTVNLSGMTEAKLLKALGDKTRNMIKQAERAGLKVVESDGRPDALDRWYALHQQSHKSLGLPPFPRAFFARMFEQLAPRKLARLLLVEQADGRAAAGAIVLIEGTRGIYAYSASAPTDRRLRPNDLMLFRMMCLLIEQGIQSCDLGSDSPEQEGLLFFKRKWLAEQKPIPRYYLGGVVPRMIDSSAARYRLMRPIVRHVPTPIARATLALFVRYFG